MSFFHQIWALTLKSLLIVVVRKPFSTFCRALALPLVFTFIVSYSKNWALSADGYGVGTPTPVLSLSDAFGAAGNTRNRVVVVDNGFKSGDIAQVVRNLSSIVRESGKDFHLVETASSLHQLCPASILGVSSCFGAVIFHQSPDHGGTEGLWRYTLAGDESLGRGIDVRSGANDNQLYTLPLQRAIDSAIALTHGGSPLPNDILQYAFTQQTEAAIHAEQNSLFQRILRSYFAFAFFVGMCGITYHLTGHMALDREKGMSQLIEAMMPNRRRWEPQLARLLSYHISFDLIYGLSWIIIGVIVHIFVFTASNIGIIIGMHVLIGLSLASFSIFASSFFRTAQLSGITVVIISLVLAVAAQYGLSTDAHTVEVLVTGVLFPPMTFMYFYFVAIGFQAQELPISLSDRPLGTTWNVTGGTFMAIMGGQIIFFMVLALIWERFLHLPSQRGRNVTFEEDRKAPFSVRTRSFSKYYYPTSFLKKVFCCMCGSRENVVQAATDLSIDLTPGSITVLLGANGSGKSTTLNAIAGIDSITNGSIDVDGVGGLGLCPQKNVMWDELTVSEHVLIFDLLKRTGNEVQEDRHKMIQNCDLATKSGAKAGTLSGGQKRKLQLAMMLIGGSRVCCVDEVSSGIDPLARRRIWDILLAERGHRSILMTTHFLDEADVLSDHIVILSKGRMRAQGTAAELKYALGNGYQITVPENIARFPTALTRLPRHQEGSHTVFPAADSRAVASIIAILETLGIFNYQIEGPTIEQVFLKIAEEMKEAWQAPTTGEQPNTAEEDDSPKLYLGMTAGKDITFFRQTWILLRKRFTILRSSYMPHFVAVLVPLVAAGMVTRFFHGFRFPNGLPCNHRLSDAYTYTLHFYPYLFTTGFVFGPSNRIPFTALNNLFGNLIGNKLDSVHLVDSRRAFNNYVSNQHGILGFGGVYNAADRPSFAWLADGPGTAFFPAFIQNLVHNSLMTQTIKIGYESFQGQFPPNAGQTLQLVIYTALAMGVYPCLLALYPTIERLRAVRALHYSNGIRSTSLWCAYILFDSIFVLIISTIAIVLWTFLFNGWYHIGYVFVVFVLFGLASAALSYCISLFAWSQLSAFAFTAGFQCGVLMLYYAGYIITQAYAPADRINSLLAIQFYTVALISPSCSLLRTLLLTLNEFSLLCRGTTKAPYPGAIDVYGGPILYLVIQFALLMIFVIYWDGGGRFTLLKRSPRQPGHLEEGTPESKASAAEEDPLRLDPSDTGLHVSHLSKLFGSNKAVDDISFGVRPSETFALLGPNGAGKSTTISLIRGDIRPSGHGGSIHICGTSLFQHREEARNHLGICPQFDAIDVMSVVEHLRFYARARGVVDVERNVGIVIDAVGLTPYKKRSAWALSGGNKRKLSLAIALVGNPAVLILDEPSSGMDAAAKRAMWKILKSVSSGRVLVITTHSMEEADTLCQRAGIMAGHMLALGTTEDLRKKYSDVCYVQLVHRDAPHTSPQEMNQMAEWIQRHIPLAQIERRIYGGQMRLKVQNGSPMLMTRTNAQRIHPDVEQYTWARCSTGSLFQLLERHREEIGFTHYSISPSTLDQVFLSVVGQHNIKEEGHTT